MKIPTYIREIVLQEQFDYASADAAIALVQFWATYGLLIRMLEERR